MADVFNVGGLRGFMAALPDSTPLLCQVVASDGSAWNMHLSVARGCDHGFKWGTDPLLVTMSHPELTTLRGVGTEGRSQLSVLPSPSKEND
jgi:hypothetical protein